MPDESRLSLAKECLGISIMKRPEKTRTLSRSERRLSVAKSVAGPRGIRDRIAKSTLGGSELSLTHRLPFQ